VLLQHVLVIADLHHLHHDLSAVCGAGIAGLEFQQPVVQFMAVRRCEVA